MTELTEEELQVLFVEFADAVESARKAFTDAVFDHFAKHSFPVTIGTKFFMDLIKIMCDSWNDSVDKIPPELR